MEVEEEEEEEEGDQLKYPVCCGRAWTRCQADERRCGAPARSP